MSAVDARLLEYLRAKCARPDLSYRTPPTRLGGGFSAASIYGFELADAPEGFEGALVLRVLAGEDALRRMRRESVAQEAAARLGFPTPRIRATGLEAAGLGGPFVVMDRLRGANLLRWWLAPIVLGALAALALWSPWPLVAGYVHASAWVGLTMGLYQRRLHRLPLESVRAVCAERELDLRELAPSAWLDTAEQAIATCRLEGHRPGVRWLREHEPSHARPTLCHGDFQPLNFMATWTRVTGVLDWELTCIADPELDIAVAKSDLTLLPGPWLGALFSPIYAFYLLSLGVGGRIDAERLRYYEALRAFFMLTMVTSHFEMTQANRAAGLPDPAGAAPDLPPFFFRMLVQSHRRRFRRLTGIDLALSREEPHVRRRT